MIDYNLAKQLSDTGFPQNLGGGQMISVSGGLAPFEGDFYVPTLSELIESCWTDSHNFTLQTTNDSKKWGACTDWGNGYDDDWEYGETPEEAVAKLWLALHEKTK